MSYVETVPRTFQLFIHIHIVVIHIVIIHITRTCMCTCIACRLIQTYLGNDHLRPEQFLRVRGVASSLHPIHWWPWLNSFADTSWPSCALWVTTGSQISKVFPRKRLEATSANLIRPGPKWLWTTSTNTAPPFWRFGRWFRAFLGLLVCSLKCMFVEGSVLYVNLQRMIECFAVVLTSVVRMLWLWFWPWCKPEPIP